VRSTCELSITPDVELKAEARISVGVIVAFRGRPAWSGLVWERGPGAARCCRRTSRSGWRLRGALVSGTSNSRRGRAGGQETE